MLVRPGTVLDAIDSGHGGSRLVMEGNGIRVELEEVQAIWL